MAKLLPAFLISHARHSPVPQLLDGTTAGAIPQHPSCFYPSLCPSEFITRVNYLEIAEIV